MEKDASVRNFSRLVNTVMALSFLLNVFLFHYILGKCDVFRILGPNGVTWTVLVHCSTFGIFLTAISIQKFGINPFFRVVATFLFLFSLSGIGVISLPIYLRTLFSGRVNYNNLDTSPTTLHLETNMQASQAVSRSPNDQSEERPSRKKGAISSSNKQKSKKKTVELRPCKVCISPHVSSSGICSLLRSKELTSAVIDPLKEIAEKFLLYTKKIAFNKEHAILHASNACFDSNRAHFKAGNLTSEPESQLLIRDACSYCTLYTASSKIFYFVNYFHVLGSNINEGVLSASPSPSARISGHTLFMISHGFESILNLIKDIYWQYAFDIPPMSGISKNETLRYLIQIAEGCIMLLSKIHETISKILVDFSEGSQTPWAFDIHPEHDSKFLSLLESFHICKNSLKEYEFIFLQKEIEKIIKKETCKNIGDYIAEKKRKNEAL